MSDELTSLNERTCPQQSIKEQLEKANNDQILERKKQNLIIEGLPESSDVNAKDAVNALLKSICVNFQAQILTAFRLGTVNKQTTRPRPRPILVKLATQANKFDIYKNVKKLKDTDNTKKVYIKDDLPSDIARQRQDMRCLAALARDNGYKASVRGAALIVDNKRYAYTDLADLPDDLTM